MIVEERVRPGEPAPPPAEKRWSTPYVQPERWRRRRARGERSGGGTFEDSAKRCAEHVIAERPSAAWSMKEWIIPMTGKRGPAVLAIGVRQQSLYQRNTPLLPRLTQRNASAPAVSFTRPGGS
jgi:hypothetical protein